MARGMDRGNSPVSDAMASIVAGDGPRRQRLGSQRKRAEPNGPALVHIVRDRSYWTVIVPFMFIARCGVQWNVYLPGLTPPNEMTYASLGFMSIGLDSSLSF